MAKRWPHRLILKGATPPVVLSFWTAQAVEIARNAAQAEREGRLEEARDYWSIARATSPADPATAAYCDEHSKVTA